MGAVDLGCACVVSFLSAAEKEGLSGIGGGGYLYHSIAHSSAFDELVFE